MDLFGWEREEDLGGLGGGGNSIQNIFYEKNLISIKV